VLGPCIALTKFPLSLNLEYVPTTSWSNQVNFHLRTGSPTSTRSCCMGWLCRFFSCSFFF